MGLELFSSAWFTALLSIIVIDLILAGDNAVVIGLAARNVPKHMQTRVIIWGTLGAIIIRALATLIVVVLLKIPGLLLIGGVLLVWIAYQLLVQRKEHHITAKAALWPAIKTIIIADAVMGLDNVLAVAGAAHGDFILVVIGLIISVPIMVWGSTLVIRFIDRFPSIIYIGSGVIAFTAAKMIAHDDLAQPLFTDGVLRWTFTILLVAAVLFAGRWKNRGKRVNPGH